MHNWWGWVASSMGENEFLRVGQRPVTVGDVGFLGTCPSTVAKNLTRAGV